MWMMHQIAVYDCTVVLPHVREYSPSFDLSDFDCGAGRRSISRVNASPIVTRAERGYAIVSIGAFSL